MCGLKQDGQMGCLKPRGSGRMRVCVGEGDVYIYIDIYIFMNGIAGWVGCVFLSIHSLPPFCIMLLAK